MADNKKKTLGELEFPLNSLNAEKSYYDFPYFNPLHWKQRDNNKHEFGLEIERVIPTEGEVRLLGNRHRDCRYYSLGKFIIYCLIILF